VIETMLFTMPEERTADGFGLRLVAATDG